MVTTTHTRRTFNLKVYDFVRDVIRHRNILVSRQISPANRMKTLRLIEELTRNNNRHYTEKAAAAFFIRRADDILFLIKQDDHQKIEMFRELINKSQTFSKI